MNIRALSAALVARLAALALLVMLAGAATASAQLNCTPSPCACGTATISIDPNLTCGVVLCDPTSPTCITFAPGDHVVDCAQLNRYQLRDCHGTLHCLPKLGTCIRCICAKTGCCVDICMQSSVAECLILKVTPSICVGC
ncbi:MAG: hypothetical protein JST22_12610 [Bacteroidetes bacterium]|nr:hypothetical protein [Bacteroidota bacterium]